MIGGGPNSIGFSNTGCPGPIIIPPVPSESTCPPSPAGSLSLEPIGTFGKFALVGILFLLLLDSGGLLPNGGGKVESLFPPLNEVVVVVVGFSIAT